MDANERESGRLDDRQAEEEFEALALEGLHSGESIEVNEKYWEEKCRRLMERDRPTGAW
jgi:hypothetical protein